MGFLAAAIPIATAVLGAMGDDKEKQAQQPMAPAKPSLGEVFAMNARNYQPQQQQGTAFQPSPIGPVGFRGQNG